MNGTKIHLMRLLLVCHLFFYKKYSEYCDKIEMRLSSKRGAVQMSWKIRKATLSDVDAITELRIELLTAVGDVNEDNKLRVFNANYNYFKERLSDGSFSAWVAEDNEVIVAISGYVLFERPPHGENISGKEAYIMNMFTKREFRGFGIGRTLLEKCIAECKSLGVGRIWLHSSKDGYPLYKKMGFTPKESEMELIL